METPSPLRLKTPVDTAAYGYEARAFCPYCRRTVRVEPEDMSDALRAMPWRQVILRLRCTKCEAMASSVNFYRESLWGLAATGDTVWAMERPDFPGG